MTNFYQPARQEVQTHERLPNGRIRWPLAVIYCAYFLAAGWAAINLVPVFATLLGGLGLSLPLTSLRLLLTGGWCVLVLIIVGAVSLIVAKQFVNFKERYRRLGNLYLAVVAIVFLPMLVFVSFWVLYRPVFHLYGKVAK